MARSKRYIIRVADWEYGISDSQLHADNGSSWFNSGLDIRSKRGILRPNSGQDSAYDKTVGAAGDGQPSWIVDDPTHSKVWIYAGDEIYEQSAHSAGALTSQHTVGSGSPAGQAMAYFNGNLYYRGGTQLGKYDYATWTDNYQTGLASYTGYHCVMFVHKNLLLIANGRYLASVDDSGTYAAQKLALPVGMYIIGGFVHGKYAVILAFESDSNLGGNKGYAFLWNGVDASYQDYFPIQGIPTAGASMNGEMYIFVTSIGKRFELRKYTGSYGQVVATIRDTETDQDFPVHQGGVDVVGDIIYFCPRGILSPASSSNQVMAGIYTYGRLYPNQPNSLNVDHTINDTVDTNRRILPMAIKWVYSSIYYSYVDKTNNPSPVSHFTTMDRLLPDYNIGIYRSIALPQNPSPYKKTVVRAVMKLGKPLVGTETVKLKISPKPFGDEYFATTAEIVEATLSTVGDYELILNLEQSSPPISSELFHVELTLTPDNSGNTRPEVRAVYLEVTENEDLL